jgi:hypothetical protein
MMAMIKVHKSEKLKQLGWKLLLQVRAVMQSGSLVRCAVCPA